MRLRKQTPQEKVIGTVKSAGTTVIALPLATKGLAVAGVGVAGGAVALLGSKRRRESVKGAAAKATAPVRGKTREYDDTTLARKVESEIFAGEGEEFPKGAISVNAQHGTIELRGQVEGEDQIQAIGKAAGKVAGVQNVHNLLHTPGSDPGHSPISDPDEVRARADGD